ncbi:nucleoside phosphorylase domain-containing protein [Penicillium diatomitis]|uniref:Nucleoside phosphorylase domain-containing protein n=1 Tax=Penicillium diatomitis TaxID=2819901 RepID=A0A9W9WTR8_9EURO|nr:nucleoside phosphorylase domain-containing protein [Penicillium diatomitis]KAJ5475365.1 nucleoside phosphorylase domain-containing protein [Penicillium diatomitis]
MCPTQNTSMSHLIRGLAAINQEECIDAQASTKNQQHTTDSSDLRRDQLNQDLDLYCVETEVIRGICDYADSHKNKEC